MTQNNAKPRRSRLELGQGQTYGRFSYQDAINELRYGQSNTVRADRHVVCLQTLSDLLTCECLLQFGYGQLCMRIQRNSLDIQIWTASAWPPRRVCYPPVVFFRHLGLRSRKEKYGAHYLDMLCPEIALNLKLRNLKLRISAQPV